MKPFGEKNMDVLQNIEFHIVEAYRENASITDFDVTDALDALTRQFSAELAGRTASAIALDPRAELVYRNVREICEYRMGVARVGAPLIAAPISKEEMISALRTILKSIKRWSGRGGKRGYLDFVKNYLP